MNFRTIAATATLLGLLSPLLRAAEEEIETAWTLEKDKTYLYKMGMRSEVSFDIPTKGPAKTIVLLDLVPELDTASVRSGRKPQATFKGTYKAVKFHLEVPFVGSMHFDSENELDQREAARDPLKRALLMLKDKLPYSFKMTDRAEVSRVSGHNRFVPRAFSGRGLKDPVPTAANAILKKILMDKMREQAFADLFIPLSKEKLLPGDRWKGSSEGLIYPLGSYLFDTEYTLKEVKEGKIAVITSTSGVKRDPRSEAGFELPSKDDPTYGMFAQLLKQLKIQESSREGTFEFDLEKGEMISGKVEMKLTLAGSFAPMGQSYDIQLDASHVRTLEREEKE